MFVRNFVVVVEGKAFLIEEQIFAVSPPQFIEIFKFPSLWKRCALIDTALLFDCLVDDLLIDSETVGNNLIKYTYIY